MPPDTPIAPCPHGLARVTCADCMPPLERCGHEFPLGLCPLCLAHELAGQKKAYALMEAGMASQCDLMDCMKQDLRATKERAEKAEAEVERLRAQVERLLAAELTPAEIHYRDYDRRRRLYACKVCGNVPDEYGILEHGRGCYTQSVDGGGVEYVGEADLTRKEASA